MVTQGLSHHLHILSGIAAQGLELDPFLTTEGLSGRHKQDRRLRVASSNAHLEPPSPLPPRNCRTGISTSNVARGLLLAALPEAVVAAEPPAAELRSAAEAALVLMPFLESTAMNKLKKFKKFNE